ncbi:serine/threonine-protein kinase [Streptomyces himalayensis]|uniref:Serine/threonine-protein kinase n=1 Tax=Streptomyces himalayensis subsp. himalayensis TaxID=2756131 RepID=A0A7W0DH28_9ACTN|nr:serine/threonine-protein kinase [Streptomyces himalayensis]MBA2944966.1 serine/threonine-protein kinase [Streptomyces himalayensis subsp. himalayensis]
MAPHHSTGAGTEAELPGYAGQYRLESCLGSGGMGVVHLARSDSGLRLAVKVVHAEFARDPEFRGRFRQEVAAARRVSGAFTAPVVDADPEAERPWMATLFIPGPTLAEHVKRNGPMEPPQLQRLTAGLAEALRDIHRAGVVHRDLKPSNVLLAEDGPKVIDFGISRPSDSELRTETGKLIGTPPFMAPEQFRRPREVGPAADIFALGSVMVHAATGRGPFDSDSPYLVAYQVVHDEPDLTSVPGNLVPLVTRCLAKEPEDRPTPDELMAQLRMVAASYDTQAFIPVRRGREPVGKDTGLGTGKGGREDVGEDEHGAGVKGGARTDVGRSRLKGLLPAAGSRPSNHSVRTRFHVALAVGAVLLTGGVAAAVHHVGAVPHPTVSGSATGQSTDPTGRQPWTRSLSAGSGAGQSARTSMCSYGVKTLVCVQPGIHAVDPQDGTVLWRRTSDFAQDVPEPPVMAGGLVLALVQKGRMLMALAPSSGKARWKLDVSAYAGGVQFAGRTVLLTSPDGTVTGVDAASGKQRWSHRLPGHDRPTFASFAADGLVYAASTASGTSGTRVTAVDPVTGEVRWDRRLDGTLSPVGTRGDAVFFVSVDAFAHTEAIVSYNASSRSLHRVRLDVPLMQARATVRGGTVYLLATEGSLTAVDMDARVQRWRLETSVSRGSTPVADAEHVYFTAADGRLLAVDARRGILLGQTSPRLPKASDRVVADIPAPLLAMGMVYASAPDGTVFAVAADDPSRW